MRTLCHGGRVEGREGSQVPGTVEVRLLGMPLRCRARLSAHVEGLLREFALIRVGGARGVDPSLPLRLLELAVDLDTTYAPYRAQNGQAMDAALAAGEEFFDAAYDAPPRSADWVRHLSEVLEEADGFCRDQRHLLTLPASEEVVAFRRWLFGEILRQLAGEAPRPWHGPCRREETGGPPATAAAPVPLPPLGPEPDGVRGTVVGQPLVMESVASAVAQARRYVRTALRRLGAEDLEEAGELAVSELVTNAMLHARTAFTVTLRTMPTGRVRVEVADTSPGLVQLRHQGPAATTGRGLQLVEAVSQAWGVEALAEREGPGKRVWFEPRPSPLGEGPAEEEWAADIAELL